MNSAINPVFDEQRREIARLMNGYAGFDEELGTLLTLSVGRVLLKAARRSEEWRASYTSDEINHIRDWLRAAILNQEPWLERIDDQNRPLKLMKFSSLSQITHEADKAMMKANQKLQDIKLAEGEETLIATLDDGYYMVRLMTPAALDKEGKIMQHCIGQGAYDELLDEYEFLSLRDASGKPHATIEISSYGHILQVQGKQNKLPETRYVKLMADVLHEKSQNFEEHVARRGIIIAENGECHAFDSLPDNSVVNVAILNKNTPGNFPKNLSIKKHLEIKAGFESSLPDDLNILGDLTISDRGALKLPRKMKIGGSFTIASSNALELPRELEVGENFSISNSSAKNLPEILSVGGDFQLTNNYKITELPSSMTIGGSIFIADSAIQMLKDDLEVNGSLKIYNAMIGELPKGLHCRGHLVLDICTCATIKTLPADLRVDGYISCSVPAFEKLVLPDDISGDIVINFGTELRPMLSTIKQMKPLFERKRERTEKMNTSFQFIGMGRP